MIKRSLISWNKIWGMSSIALSKINIIFIVLWQVSAKMSHTWSFLKLASTSSSVISGCELSLLDMQCTCLSWNQLSLTTCIKPNSLLHARNSLCIHGDSVHNPSTAISVTITQTHLICKYKGHMKCQKQICKRWILPSSNFLSIHMFFNTISKRDTM